MSTSFAATAAFFDALASRYGDDARASDWGSDTSQQLRFAVVAGIADLRDARLLDVGCGVGRLADFLAGRGIDVDYVGIDLSARAIAEGRAARPHLDLRVSNLLDLDAGRDRFDVVVANGIFYRLGQDETPIAEMLVERMWQLARRAVAFTSLSTWAPDRPADELHLDPLRALEHARSLTPLVTLRHDYLPHDFAVYLHRAEAGA